MKKECVAMLLAGGQGSRLYVLTSNMAKPAVPFGGKFRIIDFPAVQLHQLRHRHRGRADPVPPAGAERVHRQRPALGAGPSARRRPHPAALPAGKGADWYKGTANAIYQNIGFIDSTIRST